jgi:hypothetical protein
MPRRKRPTKPVGGGGARNPHSLANLQRPVPAPPGNRRAIRHGAFMTIRRQELDEEIGEIYRALADSVPVRDADGDLPVADDAAVEVAARALKRWRHVSLWCDTFGRFDERTGQAKDAATYELQCERRLHEALDVLGLNPTTRAKLGLDLARATSFDLARHWQEEGERDA